MIIGVVWVLVLGEIMPYLPVNRFLYVALSIFAPTDFYLGKFP